MQNWGIEILQLTGTLTLLGLNSQKIGEILEELGGGNPTPCTPSQTSLIGFYILISVLQASIVALYDCLMLSPQKIGRNYDK